MSSRLVNPGQGAGMTIATMTGTRLRERRKALARRQGDVARAAGISASYLNLIEHDRRRATGPVLVRLAEVLGLDVSEFDEGRAAVLMAGLRAAAADALPRSEVDRMEDFAARFPGWAALAASLHGRAAELERLVETLNDRLSHDPHLSAAVHDMLSSVSAVRATAAILAEDTDIGAEWRDRFHRNIHQDSEKLALGAEALVAYLDGSSSRAEGPLTPQEEVEAWLSGQGWHLAALEPGGDGPDALAEGISVLGSNAARQLAGEWVRLAARDAAILPRAILESALAAGMDPLDIAAAHGGDVLCVFRRIATLPGRPEGLVICDGSGTITFRKPIPAFVPPRFGAACPLWPLFTALARPLMPIEVIAEMDGRGSPRLRLEAFGVTRHVGGAQGVELREAAMLVTPAPNGQPGARILPIGTTCRVCARKDCPARREPSIMGGSL